jgi:hypothetical protein
MLSVVAFIPLYLVDHFGIGKEHAGALFAIIYSAGLWMSPWGDICPIAWEVRSLLVACLWPAWSYTS